MSDHWNKTPLKNGIKTTTPTPTPKGILLGVGPGVEPELQSGLRIVFVVVTKSAPSGVIHDG